jgi:hypothetical protein
VQFDLHGYRPSEIVWNGRLIKIVQQCWEMGESELRLIHGHGRGRGKSPGFYNTRTGRFGLAIRRLLRRNRQLRQWIKYTTLDCRKWGATSVKLKRNPSPTRTALDAGLFEDRSQLAQSGLGEKMLRGPQIPGSRPRGRAPRIVPRSRRAPPSPSRGPNPSAPKWEIFQKRPVAGPNLHKFAKDDNGLRD